MSIERKQESTLIKIVGINILAYSKLLQHNMNDTFIPPTEEEFIAEYHHNVLFARTVDNIVCSIIHELDNEK